MNAKRLEPVFQENWCNFVETPEKNCVEQTCILDAVPLWNIVSKGDHWEQTATLAKQLAAHAEERSLTAAADGWIFSTVCAPSGPAALFWSTNTSSSSGGFQMYCSPLPINITSCQQNNKSQLIKCLCRLNHKNRATSERIDRKWTIDEPLREELYCCKHAKRICSVWSSFL